MLIKTPEILKEIASLVGFKKDDTAHDYCFTKAEYFLILNFLRKVKAKKNN